MRIIRFLVPSLLICFAAFGQEKSFQLDTAVVKGSSVPSAVVLEIAGLKTGTAVTKTQLDAACQRLSESGMFTAANYQFAPGKKGYVLTLELEDVGELMDAVLDVTGADENEAWQWLAQRFSRPIRRVPRSPEAHTFLAAELQRHLGQTLGGQRLITKMEADFATGRSAVAFRPETLPRVLAISFTGNQGVPSATLNAVLDRLALGSEYTARSFQNLIELNLRPCYEEHGYYKAAFRQAAPKIDASGATLSIAVEEGLNYRLEKVDLTGEDLPLKDMLAAAKFPTGDVANWKKIDRSLQEATGVLRRAGYLDARAEPQRQLDDSARTLSLTARIHKGSLYHFGQVTFAGLAPDQERKARETWKMRTGDVFRLEYPNDFVKDLSRTFDLRNINISSAMKKGDGDHVMDMTITFSKK